VNPYVTGGYSAAAAILGLYAVYVRVRARRLARAVPADGRARPEEPR